MKKKRSLLSAVVAFILYFTFAAAAQAQTGFDGDWVNLDVQTRGMTSIAISERGPSLDVRVWGRCHPRDCDWGRTKMYLVGGSVEDGSFQHGYAIWQPGFATKYVTFWLSEDENYLTVETITIFRDRSGRSNFRMTERFRRGEEKVNSRSAGSVR